jgi:deoxyribodipyrimidine photo-lyase
MSDVPLFPLPDPVSLPLPPTRAAGLSRLAAFAPAMGSRYASGRNHDRGPQDRHNVSVLSAHVRHRLVLEEELVSAALSRFTLSTAEKFVQEVCWRTYWKGWLESRPSVWTAYEADRDTALQKVEASGSLRKAYRAACEGRTGIDAFDAWARELADTGYLHNHTRMWFASIWIWTLNLPWELGADLFLHHLADADAASNTLSWRWVAGLHTPGKTYLARPDNIATYTSGRFRPDDLARFADPVEGYANPAPLPLPAPDKRPQGRVLLWLTEEDLSPETWTLTGCDIVALAGTLSPQARSPMGVGTSARTFTEGALTDALARASRHFGLPVPPAPLEASGLARLARSASADTIVTGFPPVGWVRPMVEATRKSLAAEGISLLTVRRNWDEAFWPHARKGFFALKEQIPAILSRLGLVR